MSDVDGGPGPLSAPSSRAQLLSAVARALGDLPRGARAAVAVSGGPDSTALAYLAAEARDDLDLLLVHVRHGLRDDVADQRVVATHATWLGVPLRVVEVEVAPRGEGPAAAARRARYAALRRVAAEEGCAVVLLGHTAEDQAETLLLRLARGTGVDGLVAMRRRADDLVRPLLRLRRADVHRFVLLEGLPSVEDPANADPAARRSRVRHEVLPQLARTGPDPVAALVRLADLAADDVAALEQWADAVAGDARWIGPVVAVSDALLAGVPTAIARRVLRRLVVEVGGGPPPSAAALARVAALGRGGAVDLPSEVRASAAAGWTALAPTRLPDQRPTALGVGTSTVWAPAGIAVDWHGPGAGPGDDGSGQITLELAGAYRPPPVAVDAPLPPGALVDRARLAVPAGLAPVWLRHRRPGDRVQLAVGRRRLQDLLVDVGLPRPMRDLWPVMVDAEDRVLWVPGVAADDRLLRAGRRAPAALLALTRARRPEAAQ